MVRDIETVHQKGAEIELLLNQKKCECDNSKLLGAIVITGVAMDKAL